MKAIQHVSRMMLAGLMGLLLVSAISCSSPTASTPMEDNTVSMANDRFAPKTLTISRGETVTWVNDDEEVHTATSDMSEGGWNTGDIIPGTARSIIFHATGTYPYHCTYHGSMGMVGTIIVK